MGDLACCYRQAKKSGQRSAPTFTELPSQCHLAPRPYGRAGRLRYNGQSPPQRIRRQESCAPLGGCAGCEFLQGCGPVGSVAGEVVGLVATEEAVPTFHLVCHGYEHGSVGSMNSPGQWADDDQRVGGQPPLFKKPLKIRPFDPRPPPISRGKNALEARVGIVCQSTHYTPIKCPFSALFNTFPAPSGSPLSPPATEDFTEGFLRASPLAESLR